MKIYDLVHASLRLASLEYMYKSEYSHTLFFFYLLYENIKENETCL